MKKQSPAPDPSVETHSPRGQDHETEHTRHDYENAGDGRIDFEEETEEQVSQHPHHARLEHVAQHEARAQIGVARINAERCPDDEEHQGAEDKVAQVKLVGLGGAVFEERRFDRNLIDDARAQTEPEGGQLNSQKERRITEERSKAQPIPHRRITRPPFAARFLQAGQRLRGNEARYFRCGLQNTAFLKVQGRVSCMITFVLHSRREKAIISRRVPIEVSLRKLHKPLHRVFARVAASMLQSIDLIFSEYLGIALQPLQDIR